MKDSKTQLNHLALVIDEIEASKLTLLLDKLATYNIEVLSLFTASDPNKLHVKHGKVRIFIYPLNQGRERLLAKFKKLLLDEHVNINDLTPQDLVNYVADDKKYPEPDLIVKISKLDGISIENSMVFEANYAEIYFDKKDPKDFEVNDVELAIRDFYERKRNFGR